MTGNPYEAPQTTLEELPLATEVDTAERSRDELLRATGLCVEGGRIQFAAGLIGILAVLLGLQRDEFFGLDEHLAKPLFHVSSVVTCVLWAWGASKNLRGYAGLADALTNKRVQGFYGLCQIHWWIQFGAVLFLVFVVTGFQRDQAAFLAAILALIVLSYFHVVLTQAVAFRYWASRLELHSAGGGYFAGGVVVIVLLALELALPLWGYRQLVTLHLGLSLMLAVTSWDFGQRYQAIHDELQERGE